MKRIVKKYSGVVPNGKVLNTKNDSLDDTYSCKYLNNNIPDTQNLGKIIVDDIACKNILPNLSESKTISGVTITKNKDNSLTFNGVATSTFNYFIFNNYHLDIPIDSYVMSLHKEGIISGTTLLSFYDQSGNAALMSNINIANFNNIKVATNKELDLKSCLLYVVSGCVFTNFTIYPQLEKGLIVHDYTPNKDLDGSINYTLIEQKIGKWVDGKPLYRKVINFGSLPNATTKIVSTTLENVNYINMYGMANNKTDYFPLNMSRPVSGSDLDLGCRINNNNIVIESKTDKSSFNAYVILEYTKTTD